MQNPDISHRLRTHIQGRRTGESPWFFKHAAPSPLDRRQIKEHLTSRQVSWLTVIVATPAFPGSVASWGATHRLQ